MSSAPTSRFTWPVLRQYDQDHLARIALPLGGIGTGTVSLGGRGNLQDWEVANRPRKGFAPSTCFFAIRAQIEGGSPVSRALEGPLPLDKYEGALGSPAPHHGLPRFRHCHFEAAYPLGQVILEDPGVPVKVRLQAFNPLIPGDSIASGQPFAMLRFLVENPGDKPARVSLCGNLHNFLGEGGQNEYRNGNGLRGLYLHAPTLDPLDEHTGTVALATTAENVSYRTNWPNLSWGDSLLDFWDDFSEDGNLQETQTTETLPIASLCASVEVPAAGVKEVTFLLGWHFPNRMTWTPMKPGDPVNGSDLLGNFYATQYEDAWGVVANVLPNLSTLENDTVRFVKSFIESDLPDATKEAALFNLSTLRSQTCFRTPDGHFFGWEGCNDDVGSCNGSCTHVWNYEQATAFLFGDLARSMRTVEFAHATHDNGFMSFRVNLPLERARDYGYAAADGQMGCLMKLYRDWQLCGDDDFLRQLWPAARKSLEFCWIPGGWDSDHDGVMEGCQHNTMDVEYYGPNPQMQGWYLGALRAAQEMATYVGEEEFAGHCRELFEYGSRWMDENLWNGEYYEHHIQPVAKDIAYGLQIGMGSANLDEPDLQLGAGCLVDQLVGQYMAHVCGLGYLHDEEKVQGTLASIMRYNYKETLWEHFNHLRSFALQEEAAILMATYPRGNRPKKPFPYANEVMTGFEYTAATHMLFEGMSEEGLKAIAAIRARYDGRKRSPFNEAECGHHYARAMASWSAVLALTGFQYSAVSGTLKFNAPLEKVKWFWSSGNAWGIIELTPQHDGYEARFSVLHGEFAVSSLWIGKRCLVFDAPQILGAGETARWSVS